MKPPRQRPTINLPEPDAEALAGGPLWDSPQLAMPEQEPEPDPVPTTDRPLSERRRRRIAEEQQRRADERARAELERPDPMPVATPEIAVSADLPPVAFEAPPLPAPLPGRDGPVPSGRHAYLVAGVASALWVGGVAAWLAFEVGSGAVELEPLRLAVYALIALAPAGIATMLAHSVSYGAALAA